MKPIYNLSKPINNYKFELHAPLKQRKFPHARLRPHVQQAEAPSAAALPRGGAIKFHELRKPYKFIGFSIIMLNTLMIL